MRLLSRLLKRSGVRPPWRLVWRRLVCFVFSHKEITDAGAITPPVRGSRPLPARQCAGCGEIMVQRTNRNQHVKQFGG